MTIDVAERPKCKMCGVRIVPITWAKNKKEWYYRSECSHCSLVRRGKPLMGDTSTPLKLSAKVLGLDVTHCMRCGWHGYCHTHHRDGKHGDESADNLEVLCPNCHMDAHHGKPKPTDKELR